MARPILIGRPPVIERRLEKAQLRIKPGVDFDVVNPVPTNAIGNAGRHHQLLARRGITPAIAKRPLRRNTTVIGAMLLRLGHADGLICGVDGQYGEHLKVVDEVIGRRSGVSILAAMNYLMLPGRSLFICDTHVNKCPTAEEIAEIALLGVEQVKRFGIHPKIALMSHSNYGSGGSLSAQKMSRATVLIAERVKATSRSMAKCTATRLFLKRSGRWPIQPRR